MLRWLIVIVLALLVFSWLQPLLRRIGLGRLPGDLHFRLRGREWNLPITTTLLLSFIAAAIGHFI